MFKKLFTGLFLLTLAFPCFAQNSPSFVILNTAVTNLAANTTNTALGTPISIAQSPAFRLYFKAEGNAGTTNGSTSVSNLVVHLSTASGSPGTTNNYDSAILSNVKVTIPNLVANTNTVSDWFELRGVRYIRVGAIENNYAGSVSNVQVILSFPNP